MFSVAFWTKLAVHPSMITGRGRLYRLRSTVGSPVPWRTCVAMFRVVLPYRDDRPETTTSVSLYREHKTARNKEYPFDNVFMFDIGLAFQFDSESSLSFCCDALKTMLSALCVFNPTFFERHQSDVNDVVGRSPGCFVEAIKIHRPTSRNHTYVVTIPKVHTVAPTIGCSHPGYHNLDLASLGSEQKLSEQLGYFSEC